MAWRVLGAAIARMTVATAADVAACVRDARASGQQLRIIGAGTWMDAGAPCEAMRLLDMAGLTGIVEYEPGDLTLTARAGTALSEIARATAAHGQWLPLDPCGAAHGTFGATVATGSYGPLAAAFGTPRNQVLGCELVTGAGDIVRGGGRVVKNVAGFDITRLMVGAWGTLGALTEITVRLRARPEVDATIAVTLGGHESVERARRWLRTTEFSPLAAELLSPALSERLGIHTVNSSVFLLRMGGNETLVRAAMHAATSLGDVVPLDSDVWRRLGAVDGARTVTMRLSDAPARLASLWHSAMTLVEQAGGVAHANVARGVVRCVIPDAGDESANAVRGIMQALPPCTRIAERGPACLWEATGAGTVAAGLAHGVRVAFDSDHLLNPGIMGTA